MIGAIFDSCPGPLSTLPYIAQRLGFTSTHDTPVFLTFLLLPGVYGYFYYSLAKTPISQSIMKSIGNTMNVILNWYLMLKSTVWYEKFLVN